MLAYIFHIYIQATLNSQKHKKLVQILLYDLKVEYDFYKHFI